MQNDKASQYVHLVLMKYQIQEDIWFSKKKFIGDGVRDLESPVNIQQIVNSRKTQISKAFPLWTSK